MSEYTREEILKLIEENGGPLGLDLSGKDLSGIDLSREAIKAELEKLLLTGRDEVPVWCNNRTLGISLEGANLEGANLQKASLNGANLQGVKLNDTNFEWAYLEGANLQRAWLHYANLKEALLMAVLANEQVSGNPANLPRATGARRAVVLGFLYPAS